MFMKTKYFKRFALTDRLVSIEELRHIAQMQARMDELVRYSPIQHLSDGYSFQWMKSVIRKFHSLTFCGLKELMQSILPCT